MSYITRDLASLAISRNAGEPVILVVKNVTANGDGSYMSSLPGTYPAIARIVDLTPKEIQRLQDKGITINTGVSIAIVGELVKAPYQVIRENGVVLTVVGFTISENVSIMMAHTPAIGVAV